MEPIVHVRVLSSAEVHEGATILRSGGLLALPTETVYGLGADASDRGAVERIFAAKGRPPDHPLIVHLGDASQANEWALVVPPAAVALAEAFWPGPLTLIVQRAGHVLDAVTGGQDTVGLRVPAHPVALALLRAFDGGVAAPSANRFGRVSPTTVDHVLDDLAAYLDPARDGVLDGGPCTVGVESTIVDCSRDAPRILRHGGITKEQLADVVGNVLLPDDGFVRASGGLAAHYAPIARVELVGADQLLGSIRLHADRRLGVLAPSAADVPPGVIRLGAPDRYDGSSLAPILYARLRDADRLGLDVLLVVRPPQDGLGAAVLDRLIRAATGSADNPFSGQPVRSRRQA